jgi:hypothetical protein
VEAMIDPKTRSRMKELKGYNSEMLAQIKSFRALGDHTADVDMVMDEAEALAERAQREVFGRYKMFRLFIGRAHPQMLKSMSAIGKGFIDQALSAGKAWKYPDSQMLRTENPNLFKKHERIEEQIRDNLYTLEHLREIAHNCKERYGAHEYILSDRQNATKNVVIGAAVGIGSTLLTQWLLKQLSL